MALYIPSSICSWHYCITFARLPPLLPPPLPSAPPPQRPRSHTALLPTPVFFSLIRSPTPFPHNFYPLLIFECLSFFFFLNHYPLKAPLPYFYPTSRLVLGFLVSDRSFTPLPLFIIAASPFPKFPSINLFSRPFCCVLQFNHRPAPLDAPSSAPPPLAR